MLTTATTAYEEEDSKEIHQTSLLPVIESLTFALMVRHNAYILCGIHSTIYPSLAWHCVSPLLFVSN